MMQISAGDMPVGAHFVHVGMEGTTTIHNLIKKTVYPDHVKLNQYEYSDDTMISVVGFDDYRDGVIAKQAEQIDRLKAALHDARFRMIWKSGKFTSIDAASNEAYAQLRYELPGIDW